MHPRQILPALRLLLAGRGDKRGRETASAVDRPGQAPTRGMVTNRPIRGKIMTRRGLFGYNRAARHSVGRRTLTTSGLAGPKAVKTKFAQITIDTGPEATEGVVEALFGMGAVGVAEENAGEDTHITAYLPVDDM